VTSGPFPMQVPLWENTGGFLVGPDLCFARSFMLFVLVLHLFFPRARVLFEFLICKSLEVRSRKRRLTAVGIRCAHHATPSTRKSGHYFADSGGRSVGIVRLRTKATEFLRVWKEAVLNEI
jgi:hypothetical protein